MLFARPLPLLLAGLAWGATAFPADGPHEWLARMESALATRNYQGTFVHEHDGQTETLQVVHRTGGGEVRERIVSLDGSGREFIRHNTELSTYFPERSLVLVENSPGDDLLLAELRRLDTAGAQFYRLSEQSTVRVSGRTAHVIAVEPLDDLRYGYQVWIDEQSGMPLKTQQRDGSGRTIEQLVFTELTMPARIPDAALQPSFDARDWRWVREQPAMTQSAAPSAPWPAADIPPGFRLTANTAQQLAGSGTAVTHLVYSDGLASVSVFLEPQGGAPAQYVESLTSVGSSSALSTVAGGLKITAIGEVPPQTVRAIASALRLAALGASPGVPGGQAAEAGQHGGLALAAWSQWPSSGRSASAGGPGAGGPGTAAQAGAGQATPGQRSSPPGNTPGSPPGNGQAPPPGALGLAPRAGAPSTGAGSRH
jgi:sigma-E factor negative regulatory protein RseB